MKFYVVRVCFLLIVLAAVLAMVSGCNPQVTKGRIWGDFVMDCSKNGGTVITMYREDVVMCARMEVIERWK